MTITLETSLLVVPVKRELGRFACPLVALYRLMSVMPAMSPEAEVTAMHWCRQWTPTGGVGAWQSACASPE